MRRMLPSFLVFLFLPLATPSALAEERLPAYLLELPDSVANVFVADASNATIYRFERTADGVSLGYQGYVSVGQNGVGKQRAWDRKTPLGIYFVVDQLDTSRLHEKYGITAFPLDYPNVLDRRYERTGDGIWVHGVIAGGGRRPPFDTDGCLALPNEDLRSLEEKFVPLVTPVIITNDLQWQDSSTREMLRIEIRKAIADWMAALAANDVHAYLSMYGEEFSYRGMTFSEWASFRVQTLEGRSGLDMAIEDLLLLADPEEEGVYLSRFRHSTTENNVTSVTMKRLYWRRNSVGQLKIIAEDNG